MYKNLARITSIIFVNLFAFLLLWNILGALFWSKWLFLIGAVIISIIPLVIFLFIEIKKTTQEFNNIYKEKKDDSNWK